MPYNKIILLPGMDGTGLLFKPLLQLSSNNLTLEIIPLSDTGYQSIDDEVERIARIIKSEPIIIFAESYSGRIAYELAKKPTTDIKHIIFAASFLSTPSYLSRFSQLLPLSILKQRLMPNIFINWLFFQNKESLQLIDLFYQSINTVDDNILKTRLRNIANMKSPEEKIDLEITYIAADNDLLVSYLAINDFKKVFKVVKEKMLPGGHFIAQTNPQECLKIINERVHYLQN